MKKVYISPKVLIVTVAHAHLMLTASGDGVTLTSGGRSEGGRSADSRQGFWDDEE